MRFKILAVAAVKINVFWVINIQFDNSNNIVVDRRGSFYPVDEGNRIIQNVGTCLPDS
jgi:hypothetical protein